MVNSYRLRELKEAPKYAAWRSAKLLTVVADGNLLILVFATAIIYLHVFCITEVDVT
jgi:hypothetical protein